MKLTARAFDNLTTRPKSAAVLWGAKGIASYLGCSEDFVRDRLAKEKDSPIKKVSGRYCAIVDDIVDFIRKGT